MRTLHRSLAVRVLALVLIASSLSGCAFLGKIGGILGRNHANDYAEKHLKLEADAVRYDAALHEIVDRSTNTRLPGIITDPQWNLFAAGVENVRTANRAVKTIMDSWGATGVRPAELDPHVDALVKAQNEVIAIVRKVRP